MAHVQYAAADRAFFDRGTSDGLTTGAPVRWVRGGRVLGTCTPDRLADHFASCPLVGARLGDELRFAPAPPTAPPHLPPRVPPPDPEQVRASRDRIAAQPFAQIAAEGTDTGAHRSLRASASLQHETWVMIGRPDTGFDAESLHLQLAGTELGRGFRLYVDATATQWTRRPGSFRAPDQSQSQLFVSDLEVSQRELGRSWTLAAGRVWAYRAAGLGVFDGAQVGWRSRDGEAEAGVFGGVLPDPVTLAPSTSTPLLGAYAAYTHGSRGGAVRWIDLEAHAATYLHAGSSAQVQLDTLARAWLSHLDVGGDVQVAPTGTDHVLEGARLDLSANPLDSVHLVVTGRYEALPNDVLTLPGETAAGHRSRRADVLVTWDALRGLTLGLEGGHVRDLDTNLWHAYGGPQLTLPRLFGTTGALALGYLEERGSSPGRSAWIQASGSPSTHLYLLARTSWFEDTADTVSGTQAFDELGLYAHADWRFSKVFWLRFSTLARLDLTAATEDTGLTVPLGLDATLSLGGEL